MISRKHKKVCIILNYIAHFLILASTITGYISGFSAFASSLGIPIGIKNSVIRLTFCIIAARIKKYKSIIKKKKHYKIVLLAKSKLNRIKVLISKTLINSNISHDEFNLISNVLKKYNKMKEIKNLKTSTVHRRFYSIYKTMLLYSLNCKKNTDSKSPKVGKANNGRIMPLAKYEVCASKKSTSKKLAD